MKSLEEMSDQEFRSHVHAVIGKEMGAYGLARFIQLTVPGRGDYTLDRHQWLEGTTADQIVERTENRAA